MTPEERHAIWLLSQAVETLAGHLEHPDEWPALSGQLMEMTEPAFRLFSPREARSE